MRILILDDVGWRHEGFKHQLIGHKLTHVYNYDEAVAALSSAEVFDGIYLDHDLNDRQAMGYMDGELTGADVALAITRLPKERQPKLVIIHSWNSAGAARIAGILYDAGIPFIRQPYSDVR